MVVRYPANKITWDNYWWALRYVWNEVLKWGPLLADLKSLRTNTPMEETSGNEARVPSKTAPPTTA